MPAARGLLLSIDQGTTNTKAALVDRERVPVFRASTPVPLLQPQVGFVEQDPQQIWMSARNVMQQCAAHALQAGIPVEGIAISNQRETAVAWQAGEPLAFGNAIGWQCRRSAAICEQLAPHHAFITATSGLPVDPLITASKWSWMLANNPTIKAASDSGTLRLGNVDAWLLACLTGGAAHATDLSNASRTALLDLATAAWSDPLAQLFGISLSALPAVRPSASTFGICTGIPSLKGVPIVAMIGDSHAAMAGHGTYAPGSAKATYGTGSSVMTLTPSLAPHNSSLARTIAWSISDEIQFALEGNITMTGSAIQWIGEFLGLANPAPAATALSQTMPDSAGLYFVPAMVGLGAPYWDAAARGSLTGIERFHTAAHLARAAVEAIAFQVADVFFAMEAAAGIALPCVRADGGATRNDTLMQFQADILGRPVLRSTNEDLSLLGAAALGGITLGWWSSLDDFASRTGSAETFSPHLSTADRNLRYEGWKRAVRRTRLEAAA